MSSPGPFAREGGNEQRLGAAVPTRLGFVCPQDSRNRQFTVRLRHAPTTDNRLPYFDVQPTEGSGQMVAHLFLRQPLDVDAGPSSLNFSVRLWPRIARTPPEWLQWLRRQFVVLGHWLPLPARTHVHAASPIRRARSQLRPFD